MSLFFSNMKWPSRATRCETAFSMILPLLTSVSVSVSVSIWFGAHSAIAATEVDESLQPAGALPVSEDNFESDFDDEMSAGDEPESVSSPKKSAKTSKVSKAHKNSVSLAKTAKTVTKTPDLKKSEPKKTELAAAAPSANDIPDAGDDEKWESYSDLPPVSSVAEEITGGVRVEDIVEPPSDYSFAAFGRADPFIPPLITQELTQALALQVDPLEIPIVSPLQRFSLNNLNIVGIWQLTNGDRKAMVMTPNAQAQGIVIKVGDPIGDRGGKVTLIADDFVMVREFLLSPDGTRQFQDQQMLMGKANADEFKGKIVFKPGSNQTAVDLENTNGITNNWLTPNDPNAGSSAGSSTGSNAVGIQPHAPHTPPLAQLDVNKTTNAAGQVDPNAAPAAAASVSDVPTAALVTPMPVATPVSTPSTPDPAAPGALTPAGAPPANAVPPGGLAP